MHNGDHSGSGSTMEPHATLSVQSIMEMPPDHHGFLRKRGQQERLLENLHLSKHINWRQRFVALHDGSCYCYADEVAKAPQQAFSLQGYYRVFRANSERATFVFTLEPAPNDRKKFHTFAASSEQERLVWMKVFKEAMMKANCVTPLANRSSLRRDDVYVDLEKMVYDPDDGTYGKAGHDEVCDDYDDDSNDSDYDFPDDLQVGQETKESLKRKTMPLPPVPQGNTTPESGVPKLKPRLSPRLSQTKKIDPSPKVPSPVRRDNVPGAQTPPGLAPRKGATAPRTKPAVSQKPNRRLSEKECLFDNDDRSAAIEILREKQAPGTFLIRRSRQGNSKVLVVMTKEDVKEYKIFTENNKVTLDRTKFFGNVDDLLENYRASHLPNREETLQRSFSASSS